MNNIIPNPIKLTDTEITNKVTLFYLFKFSRKIETSKIIKKGDLFFTPEFRHFFDISEVIYCYF